MRSLFTLALLLLSACGAPEVQSQRLKDGSWSFQCELSMDECVRKVQDNCPNQRYRILEGSSQTRMRDVPPFEKAYHTSKLRLECNNDSGDALISFGGDKAAPASSTAPSAVAPAPVSKPPVCGQGQTRECVGVGACKGGQACLADGSGYGVCDCGPAPAPPATVDVPPPSAAPAPSASSPSK
jgi:hypothetical protein